MRSSPGRISTFATLQGLELRLGRLARRLDSATVVPESRTTSELEERLDAHRDCVQVNYCRFNGGYSGGEDFVKRLGKQNFEVFLENDASERRVAQRIALQRQGSVAQSYETMHSQSPAGPGQLSENTSSIQYRCYAVYFKRLVDGEDILEGFTKLTFWPRHSPKRDAYYTWTLPRSETASVKGRD